MKTAYINLRHNHGERFNIFKSGFKALGYEVVSGFPDVSYISKGDVFCTWNRFSQADRIAKAFESGGGNVIVCENATWGNEFAGKKWLHIAKKYHNTAGMFNVGSSSRWDSLKVELLPFRCTGETVILPQRGLGSSPVRMPASWPVKALKKYQCRVRSHPGNIKPPKLSLEDDLANCRRVITWGSGAAIKALIMGVNVVSEMPNWIGEQDNTEESRLAMFNRLAWAQWTHEEIESGFAFTCLINR